MSLFQDCDLVIFGTQRHGVPKMPEVAGGRITVPIFFYPTSMQMKKQWQTLTDPEDPRKSTELSKLQSSHQLGADTLQLLWSDPARNAALQQLLQLGFEESASKNALQSAAFDAEHAAELLLMAGAADDLGLQERMGSSSSCQPNRWGKKLAKAAKAQAAFIPTEAQLNSPVYPFFIFFFSGSPRVWERDWKNFM